MDKKVVLMYDTFMYLHIRLYFIFCTLLITKVNDP